MDNNRNENDTPRVVYTYDPKDLYPEKNYNKKNKIVMN